MKTTNKIYLFENVETGEAKDASSRLLCDALSSFFAEIGEEAEEVKKDPMGKPYFPSGRYHLSVTHTGGVYLCAFAPFPIGVDAEREGEVRPHVADRFFSQREKELPFSLVWTAKEAVAKLLGGGLSLVGKIKVEENKAFYKDLAFDLKTYVKNGVRVTLCFGEGADYAVQTLSKK